MKIIKKQSSKKLLTIGTTAILAVAIISYFAYGYATKNTWPFQQPLETNDGINSVDYNPPSSEDVKSSQDAKNNNEANNNPQSSDDDNTNTETQKRGVEVGISYADIYENNVEIRAFTPGVIEGSGTCTITLSQDQQRVVRTVKAFIDSSSSQCEPVYIPLSEFLPKGKWTLQVTYESPTSNGKSDSREITI